MLVIRRHALVSARLLALAAVASAGDLSLATSFAAARTNPASPGPLTHPAPDTTLPNSPSPSPGQPRQPRPLPPAPQPIGPLPSNPMPDPLVDPLTGAPLGGSADEAPYLTGHLQLTSPKDFSKAGEAYFEPGPNPQWIIFQAIPAGSSETNYQMYLAKLARDGAGKITGLDPATKPIKLSPDGSSSTCGWFSPTEPGRVIFGCTMVPPKDEQAPGYSRDRQSYQWKFPAEMRVVSMTQPDLLKDQLARGRFPGKSVSDANEILAKRSDLGKLIDAFPLKNGPGYAAECSFSPDGRFLLFTYRDPKTQNPDIWVLDTVKNEQTPLITTKGYNGGPFFSPDGKRICYRSDRRGDNNLQLFIAELAIDAKSGSITGIGKETQLTDDGNVNWTPYFHPSGNYLIFASSAAGHRNYEVFAIDLAANAPANVPANAPANSDPKRTLPPTSPVGERTPGPAARRWARITLSEGFDGLPVFDQSGSLLMWTSQRGPKLAGESKPSSQIWIATVTGAPSWWPSSRPSDLPPVSPVSPTTPITPPGPSHPR